MNEGDRAALTALRFSWVQGPDDVWRPSPFHVNRLHPAVLRDVLDSIAEAKASSEANPIGLALEGRHGTGKTHLLGWIREQVQQQGGYFFLIGVLVERKFWEGMLTFLLDGMARPVSGTETQLRLFLRRLSARVGAPRSARRSVIGETELTKPALDAFLDGLKSYEPHVATRCRDTLRALALMASDDEEHQYVAEGFFFGDDESVPGERQKWGIRRSSRTSQETVRDISWLLALTGPSVITFDQIDTVVAQAALQEDLAKTGPGSGNEMHLAELAANLANGLTDLRDTTRRTFTVVAALSDTWSLLERWAPLSFGDRFRRSMSLESIRTPSVAQEIIEKRFASRFQAIGFEPDYPTWPILPEAFDEAVNYTPRRLIQKIDRHIRGCLIDGEARELRRLSDVPESDEGSTGTSERSPALEVALSKIQARFEELKLTADVTSPLECDTEDAEFPSLISSGLHAWIVERGKTGSRYSIDPPPSAKPDLHARLRRDLDERTDKELEESSGNIRTEDQLHWAFRAISDTHHGVAALHRIRRARTAAGLTSTITKRRLFLVRNGPWSSSAKTQEVLQELEQDGGRTLGIDESDLRILAALRALWTESPPELEAWLLRYQPAEQITLFKEALAEESTATTPETTAPATQPDQSPSPLSFTLGYGYDDTEPVILSLDALRKHGAIFAASGSGKTVLIRHIVEECALHGVSAIVLDPNNDLARLGDPWPSPPTRWHSGDADRAANYLAETEVVVWTPRRESGRALTFQPMPDFRSILDNPDEFSEAVEAAVATLAPQANLSARTSKAHLGMAVLRRTVEHFGRQGGSDIRELIALLSALPDGVSTLDDAAKIAAGLAQTLTASMDNDPMFGGRGVPADPGMLLTPSVGKRARISVISMVGLREDAARQSFVNQLQMSLFAWIKKNPARDRPLLGLLVMDEAQAFAPSGAMTACTQSTLALASQARKYGLGLLFATQSPKYLHNRIPGNAATHIFGRLTVPVQIEAAREMAKVKGGNVPDIGNLTSGEFYVALEGEAPAKVRTPLCLSYHPESPLTDEEVLDRARA